MTRPLRLEYPGAIYHITSRGNAQAPIVLDDTDRQRWCAVLAEAVTRQGWELLSFVLMDNHFHLVVRTPVANLSRGMQRLLSSYATWFARRLGRRGHVFQGRFHAKIVADTTYYWTVTRYVHLNPVRAGMVARAIDWPWSSFPGFVAAPSRVPWVAYQRVLDAAAGEFGGARDIASRYRAYVEGVDARTVTSPFLAATDGWILGDEAFVNRLRSLAAGEREVPDSEVPDDVQLRSTSLDDLVSRVLVRADVETPALRKRGHRAARYVVAHLARLRTDATLGDIARVLGFARPQCVPSFIHRVASRGVDAAHIAELLAAVTSDLDAAQCADLGK